MILVISKNVLCDARSLHNMHNAEIPLRKWFWMISTNLYISTNNYIITTVPSREHRWCAKQQSIEE